MVLIIFFVLASVVSWAQPVANVRVDQIDSLRNTYAVTYIAPSSSVYAEPIFQDTLFCAAVIGTLRGTVGVVKPMQRVSGATYRSQLVVPDSAYMVRIEICIPTDRAPDGILSFYVRPDGGEMWPGTAILVMPIADSGLAYERRHYPGNYFAYHQYWVRNKPSDVEDRIVPAMKHEWRLLDSLIGVVRKSTERTFNRYMTLALMYAEREGGDPSSYIYLDSAVATLARSQQQEPLLERDLLWNYYYYPEQRNGRNEIDPERFIRTQRLAELYPRTAFGKYWVERLGGIAQLDTAVVHRVFRTWSDSYDVDVLSAIASRMLDTSSTLFDPSSAERILLRAQMSSDEQLGFRSGENIFASMGRTDEVNAKLIKSISLQGRHQEARLLGERSMRTASGPYGRQSISAEYANACLRAGDTDAAEKARNYTLPVMPNFEYGTIDGRSGSIEKLRGKIVVIDFWFIGCHGCALEHKSLNDFGLLYKGDERVVFLSVALNDKTTLENYLSRSPLAADVIYNARDICEKAGVTAFPTHVILDQNGKTLLWEAGGSVDAGERLAKAVGKLLR
ncbi:MAG: TlpA family protein disulfide reductase [Candidatus Kapabacteria bacterium]|nr:TlpA family protein disulfide reductase [Ignavibacteria bacterium]MBK6418921.1 TlpA family protein disulfide reductase [Ignavibacteria bacterium]MBP6509564.1 TlpA family protein disulfide reductase [Candidatus Kapabacteria bacterium]MBP7093452.1 TlpA family protein disulfide reductase [Candidatus Kapabacteria bacterium]